MGAIIHRNIYSQEKQSYDVININIENDTCCENIPDKTTVAFCRYKVQMVSILAIGQRWQNMDI